MHFSRSEQKKSKAELETILEATEEDNTRRETVLKAFDMMQYFQKKYNNPLSHPINYLFKRDGMTVYIGHEPETSPLRVNGKEAVHLQTKYSIHSKEGQKQLEQIFRRHTSSGNKKGNDGAVEMNFEGIILSYRRIFKVEPDDIAVKYNLVKEGEEASSRDFGFYEDVCMRHKSAESASLVDRRVYFITKSEETGKIRVFYDGKIMNSPIKEEIHPTYRQYRASNRGTSMNASSVIGADFTHPEVHGAGVISPHDLRRMALSMSYERRLEHHSPHYL